MDANEFRKRGEEVVDYCVDYFESLSLRNVTPNVTPGFLFPLLPSTAPEKGESFENIMNDFEKYIMPGLTHWQHPAFHAYFPANSSYPSILGEVIANAITCTTLTLNISRSEKELDAIAVDCFGKMIGLPDDFLHSGTDSIGGGFMRNSSSECVFIALLAARHDIFKKLQDKNPSMNPATFLPSLVAYCSKESHACVEKACMATLITIKLLETDDCYRLRGETFAKVVEEDIKNGLIPFFASITLGTTSSCACDPIDEIGPICKANDIWLNVDAAYGGSAMICPEYRHLFKGIEYASTIITNPVKWMLVNCEGAVMWTKYYSKVYDTYSAKSNLFHYSFEENWYQPNRRLRALKLWCVIRNYGVELLQKFIRHHIQLAKLFENCVRNDERFEVLAAQFGLVCFRLKGSNALNRKLLKTINDSGKIHVTPCLLDEKFIIRFCVCSKSTTDKDVTYAWTQFSEFADELHKTKI